LYPQTDKRGNCMGGEFPPTLYIYYDKQSPGVQQALTIIIVRMVGRGRVGDRRSVTECRHGDTGCHVRPGKDLGFRSDVRPR